MSAQINPEPGVTIGHFRLQKLLGEGGMGAVYLAEDLTLSRRVAIKFMKRSLLSSIADPVARSKVEQRFIREAKSSASLNHPHIAQVYEANFDSDNWYIAMEFINGEPLDELVENNKTYDPADVIQLLKDACNGLEYAWEHCKIIHRDIKPANIMQTQKMGIKIVDLGLAKPITEVTEQEMEVTAAGVPVGTPYYMAPEQALGDEVDLRADIFALGATVYEILTGKKAFLGKTPPVIFNLMMSKSYKAITEFRDDVPQALIDIITKMLEPERDNRYLSYMDLLADLNILSGGSADLDATVIDTRSYGSVITGATLADGASLKKEAILPVDYKIADRYRILRLIGRGNTGVVYYCMDTRLEKECSVKAVASGREYSKNDFGRIKQNYKKLANEKHPNLVEILDLHESTNGDEIFVVMELLKGTNLMQYAENVRLEISTPEMQFNAISEVMLKVANALDSIGESIKRVHCDLKPVSIFIGDDGEVKLLDYGIVFLNHGDDVNKNSPEVYKFPIANPDYMSPELWKHESLSLASDQYSLAVIIYEMLARKLPFWTYEAMDETLFRTMTEDDYTNVFKNQFENVTGVAVPAIEHLSAKENQVLSRALAKFADNRYTTNTDFILALSGRSSKSKSIALVATLALVGIGGAFFAMNSSKKASLDNITQLEKQFTEIQLRATGLPELSTFETRYDEIQQLEASGDLEQAEQKLQALKDELDASFKQFQLQLEASLNTQKETFQKHLDEIAYAKHFESTSEVYKAFDELVKQEAKQLAHKQELLDKLQTSELIRLKDFKNEALLEKKAYLNSHSEHLITLRRQRESLASVSGKKNELSKLDEFITLKSAFIADESIEKLVDLEIRLTEFEKGLAVLLNDIYKENCSKIDAENKLSLSKLQEWAWLGESFSNELKSFSRKPALDEHLLKKNFISALPLLEAESDQLKKLNSLQQSRFTELKDQVSVKLDEVSSGIDEFASYTDYLEGLNKYSKELSSLQLQKNKGDWKQILSSSDKLQKDWNQYEALIPALLIEKSKIYQEKANELMQELSQGKMVSPMITAEVEELEVELGIARSARQQRKYDEALPVYQDFLEIGAELLEQIKELSTVKLSENWNIPGLNMKFTWLEEMTLWSATYEVTNGQLRKFRPEHNSKVYPKGSLNGDNQPATEVSYEDAEAFCRWLTSLGRRNNQIPKGYVYKVPSMEQWQQLASSGKKDLFPWGAEWPPTKGINLASKGSLAPGESLAWDDYSDPFLYTAPVEKSVANAWGLYGTSGNVWEWTSTAEGNGRKVMGGSWNSATFGEVKLNPQGNVAPSSFRGNNVGFRVILVPVKK